MIIIDLQIVFEIKIQAKVKLISEVENLKLVNYDLVYYSIF